MPTETKPKQRHRLLWTIICLAVIAAYVYLTLVRPLPVLQPDVAALQLDPSASASDLSWPPAGEAAVGYNDAGVVATHGAQKPVPTASTAKLITALSVLSKDPLQVGQQGPTITLTQADVNLYDTYLGEDGSIVPVAAGEQISEYQMLECMLLPSANNMADSLAIWAFGSLDSYAAYANQYTKTLGLTDTHIGVDASGFDPSTTSTASDLVRVGEAVMQNPVLAQIVAQPSAGGIPVAGTIRNVNDLLGTDGIDGIKTGNTDQAGGVFVSASKATVAGQTITVVTALAGAATLSQALSTSVPLVRAAQANFINEPVVTGGSVLGSYALPWGGTVQAVAKDGLDAVTWKGTPVSATVHLSPITADSKAGQVVGTVSAQKSSFTGAQTASVVLKQAPAAPPLWWRLSHP